MSDIFSDIIFVN